MIFTSYKSVAVKHVLVPSDPNDQIGWFHSKAFELGGFLLQKFADEALVVEGIDRPDEGGVAFNAQNCMEQAIALAIMHKQPAAKLCSLFKTLFHFMHSTPIRIGPDTLNTIEELKTYCQRRFVAEEYDVLMKQFDVCFRTNHYIRRLDKDRLELVLPFMSGDRRFVLTGRNTVKGLMHVLDIYRQRCDKKQAVPSKACMHNFVRMFYERLRHEGKVNFKAVLPLFVKHIQFMRFAVPNLLEMGLDTPGVPHLVLSVCYAQCADVIQDKSIEIKGKRYTRESLLFEAIHLEAKSPSLVTYLRKVYSEVTKLQNVDGTSFCYVVDGKPVVESEFGLDSVREKLIHELPVGTVVEDAAGNQYKLVKPRFSARKWRLVGESTRLLGI